MEEKKLTDEEIVKALELCVKNDCEKCPYLIKGFDCVISKQAENDFLDLIHRLQDENAELEEDNERWEAVFKIGEERKYRKMFNEEWKKEYQKELDKQGEGLIAGSPDFDYVYELYFKQKAEIERLTGKVENQKAVIKGQNKAIEKEKSENKRLYDEYVRLDDFCAGKGCLCCICECKETCNECAKCGSLKTEKCKGFRIDVSKYARAIERADKLQKQVDELKNAYNDLLETCRNCDTTQAVKDKAKEILGELSLFFKGTTFRKGYEFKKIDEKLKELKKRNGVEVE